MNKGALPAPNFHWELNGRTTESDQAPIDCSRRHKLTTTIHSNNPGIADGRLNPVTHSTLMLEEGPSSLRHNCALRSMQSAQVYLGTFEGHCMSSPNLCSKVGVCSHMVQIEAAVV